MKVGISAIQFDIPKIYVPIADLAKERNIEPAKLEKGLGLLRMSFPDVHQDAVVFAANALQKLQQTAGFEWNEIHRIYVGTESAVDSSKPIASYLIQIMEQQFGAGTLSHIDAVDYTFACISGVDALQNCLDFVRVHPNQKAIVICADIAKYDLGSPGEYTQGAGAIALLVSQNPSIMAFDTQTAVSTEGVFDFFKPRRIVSKSDVTFANPSDEVQEKEVEIFKEQPVFDGQYSNTCYVNRTHQAYYRLKELKKISGPLYQNWKAIIMHLPYSFQARRMFTDIYIDDHEALHEAKKSAEDAQAYTKEISKSEPYKAFAQEMFMPSERASSLIGNMYTGSIFMALLSNLLHHKEKNTPLDHAVYGFMAYGSGSKSKVFEGELQPDWESALEGVQLFETLENTQSISYSAYEQLHTKELTQSIVTPNNEFVLDHIESDKPNLIGARYYRWVG